MGLQVSQSMVSAGHGTALRVALVAQRNGHDGEQAVEEPLPGVQTLTGSVAHSDVFAPPFHPQSSGSPSGCAQGTRLALPPHLIPEPKAKSSISPLT